VRWVVALVVVSALAILVLGCGSGGSGSAAEARADHLLAQRDVLAESETLKRVSAWKSAVRIFLGFLIAGLDLGAAVWLHGARLDHQGAGCGTGARRDGDQCVRGRYTFDVRPAFNTKGSWQDPLAVVLAVAGVGAGVALVVPALRRTV
jgi:hypothetical protein